MSFESIKAAIGVLASEPVRPAPKKRDCQLCEADKAVGKYYVDPLDSENHGWWRVCDDCADMVSGVGADVQFYKYSKKSPSKKLLPEHVTNCEHVWVKWSLISEQDKRTGVVFDWMRCEKCECYGKRFRLGQTTMEDLSMEIDLNCSR